MKKYYFILFFVFFTAQLFSQNKSLQLYHFQEKSEIYTSIFSVSTALTPNDWDDGCTPVTNIGFDFEYNGKIYTQFSVNTNGTVNLGDNIVNEETNDLESVVDTNILAPLWDDLKFYSSGVGDGIYFYLDNSVTDSNVLTIEFLQVGRYSSTGYADFQVKLFEYNNSIEFVYGDLSGTSGWSSASTASIGMNSMENDQNVFLSVTPDNINGATVSFNVENDQITPSDLAQIQSGTVYSFRPLIPGTEPDIQILDIISPVSNFLTNHDTVKIQIANPGIEITEGLTIQVEVFDTITGSQIGTTINENFSDYPILFTDVFDYTLSNTIDLSDNGIYRIVVTLILADDINVSDNQMFKIVEGVNLDELIYDNGPIITHENQGSNGADVSAVQVSLGFYNYGYNTNWIIGYRNADDFTVPEGQTWTISGLGFYNWQTESDTVSTIDYLDFRIFDGLPSETSSQILVDYYDQNKLSGSKWSGIYRNYDNDMLNIDRPVMFTVASLNDDEIITLEAGDYWIDWSSGGSMLSGPWVPFISILGETTTGNAMHLGYEGWVDWTDDGTSTQQGMPFMFYGQTQLSISEVENQTLIYPNPNNGIFTISTETCADVFIYDITGKKIYSGNIEQKKVIDLSSYDNGIYIVEVLHENFTEKIKMIISK
ncbi:MAG: T9SS type A sorting domain-containing protein [Bacteroidales bacterium]|nr:T9SS type A sorting domain-containing protein [Bacteroidales bacterium]